MKWFLELGNRYARQSDWKDFALVKLCLCAIGVMIGLSLPSRAKKVGMITAGLVFVATYAPLMAKVIRIARTPKD